MEIAVAEPTSCAVLSKMNPMRWLWRPAPSRQDEAVGMCGAPGAAAAADRTLSATVKHLLKALRSAAEATPRPPHVPLMPRFPLPHYLKGVGYEHTINIGVIGASGSGTSSLVNAMRSRDARDPDAAPVGITKTTTTPTAYSFTLGEEDDDEQATGSEGSADGRKAPKVGRVRLWDLPGLDKTFSMDLKCRDFGLRYFDAIVLVCAKKLSETDVALVRELDTWGVPHFVVRTQVDLSVKCAAADHNSTEEEVLTRLRSGLERQGVERGTYFLVSSRVPDRYELERLCMNVLAPVYARRKEKGKTDEGACLLCGCNVRSNCNVAACTCVDCKATVCSRCVALLSGDVGEAVCPMCTLPGGLTSTGSCAILNWMPSFAWLWFLS